MSKQTEKELRRAARAVLPWMSKFMADGHHLNACGPSACERAFQSLVSAVEQADEAALAEAMQQAEEAAQ